jgi:hypothetical protein
MEIDLPRFISLKDDPNLFESDVPETTRALVDLYSETDDVSKVMLFYL